MSYHNGDHDGLERAIIIACGLIITFCVVYVAL